jgi:hypothetical protein
MSFDWGKIVINHHVHTRRITKEKSTPYQSTQSFKTCMCSCVYVCKHTHLHIRLTVTIVQL